VTVEEDSREIIYDIYCSVFRLAVDFSGFLHLNNDNVMNQTRTFGVLYFTPLKIVSNVNTISKFVLDF